MEEMAGFRNLMVFLLSLMVVSAFGMGVFSGALLVNTAYALMFLDAVAGTVAASIAFPALHGRGAGRSRRRAGDGGRSADPGRVPTG